MATARLSVSNMPSGAMSDRPEVPLVSEVMGVAWMLHARGKVIINSYCDCVQHSHYAPDVFSVSRGIKEEVGVACITHASLRP